MVLNETFWIQTCCNLQGSQEQILYTDLQTLICLAPFQSSIAITFEIGEESNNKQFEV